MLSACGDTSGWPSPALDLDVSSPAYVLDLSPNGLGAVRILAAAGVRVRSFDAHREREGFASRFGRPSVCPDPIAEPDRLADFLITLAAREEHRPFLLPCTDKFAMFVSRRRHELADYFAFVLPREDLFLAFLSKDGTYELARSAGVAVPQTALLGPNERDERHLPSGFPFPALIKPSLTYTLQSLIGAKVIVLRDRREAKRAMEWLPPQGTLILQEIIPGEETRYLSYNSYRDAGGRILAEFVNRKIRRSPPGFGTVAMLESRVDEEFLTTARAMLDQLDFTGLANTEFKRDPRDGALKLIEVNPRLWLCHPLSSLCGVHFVLTAYRDATGQDPVPQRQTSLTARWQHLTRDLQVSAFHVWTGRATLSSVLSSFGGQRRLAVWDPRDPLPSLRLAGLFFLKAFTSLYDRVRTGRRRSRRRRLGSLPYTSWTRMMNVIDPR